MAAYQNVVNQGQTAASQPLQQYGGPLVAGFTPDQTQAMQEVQNAQGLAQPYINAATQYAGIGAAPVYPNIQQFSPQSVSQYQSPYTQQVVQSTQQLFNEQNAEQQNQLAGSAAQSGAFGGERQGVAQAQLAAQQALTENPQLASLENQGYSQALGELNTQQQLQANVMGSDAYRASNAGYQLGALGQQSQSDALTGASALLSSGALQQSLGQEELNIPYEEFQQQQAYPYQQLGWLAGITEGAGGLMGGTGSTTGPGSSALGTAAGLGAAGFAGYQLANSGSAAPASSALSDAGAGYADYIPTDVGSFGYRRGGVALPRRAGGGGAPSSAVPDVGVDIIPAAPSGGNSMMQPTGSTTTGAAPDNTLGTILQIAQIAAIAAAARGGRIGARRYADGGDVPGVGADAFSGLDYSSGAALPKPPKIISFVPPAASGSGHANTIPHAPGAANPNAGQPSIGDDIAIAKFGKSLGKGDDSAPATDSNSDESDDGHARGGAIRRQSLGGYDDGGMVSPTTSGLVGGVGATSAQGQAQTQDQRYLAMPIDKLQQLANTYPPNTQMGKTVRAELQKKMMMPQSSAPASGAIAAPTAPQGPGSPSANLGGPGASSGATSVGAGMSSGSPGMSLGGLASGGLASGGGASDNPSITFVSSPSYGVDLPQVSSSLFAPGASGSSGRSGFSQGLGTGTGGLGNAYNPLPQTQSPTPPNVITNPGTPQASSQPLPAYQAQQAAAAPALSQIDILNNQIAALQAAQQNDVQAGTNTNPVGKRGGRIRPKRVLPKRADGGSGLDDQTEEVPDDSGAHLDDQLPSQDVATRPEPGGGYRKPWRNSRSLGTVLPTSDAPARATTDLGDYSAPYGGALPEPDNGIPSKWAPKRGYPIGDALHALGSVRDYLGKLNAPDGNRGTARAPVASKEVSAGAAPAVGAVAATPPVADPGTAAPPASPDADEYGAERDLIKEAQAEGVPGITPVKIGDKTAVKVDPYAGGAALDFGAGYNPPGSSDPGSSDKAPAAPTARPDAPAIAAVTKAATAKATAEQTPAVFQLPPRPTQDRRQRPASAVPPHDPNRNFYMGLLAAGLGTLGSRSPFAMQAIGEGGLTGLKTYEGLAQQDSATALKQQEIARQADRDDMLRQHYANVDDRPVIDHSGSHTKIYYPSTGQIIETPFETEASLSRQSTEKHQAAEEDIQRQNVDVARERAEHDKLQYVAGQGKDPVTGEIVPGTYQFSGIKGEAPRFYPGVVQTGKPGGGKTTATEFKYNTWLAVHPGDHQGALDYVAGHKQMAPQDIAKAAATLAQRELGSNADPADLDARAKAIYKNIQSGFGAAAAAPAAPAPTTAGTLPAGVTAQQAVTQAKATIAANPAARDAVLQRLKGWGVDTTGL